MDPASGQVNDMQPKFSLLPTIVTRVYCETCELGAESTADRVPPEPTYMFVRSSAPTPPNIWSIDLANSPA